MDEDGATLLAIDRVMLHERTGGVALGALAKKSRAPLSPSRVFAIMDHVVSFREGRGRDESRSPGGEIFITETRSMAKEAGINVIDTDDARQGIVHVVAPEQGIAYPGVSIICPDSHTCSLGALGALAIGVGSSEAEHAMATGVIRTQKPPQLRIWIDSALREGVTAKDLALHIIKVYGADGGKRSAIEFAGPAVDSLSIEERLTLCNLAVEFSAFTAVIAPDRSVAKFVSGRPFAPGKAHWQSAIAAWSVLKTDDGAVFDNEICVDAGIVGATVSWGTSPEQSIDIDEEIPSISSLPDRKQKDAAKAMDYMGVAPGVCPGELEIDGVFIGSCTNGRLSDLRAAAAVLKGRKIAEGVRAVCVPGSQEIRRRATEEGLDQIFKDAGFEWGEPGCAMCFYAGGETFPPGARVVSSTNRNFEGRQGPGVRTHLASPATAAASAVAGRIVGAHAVAGENPSSMRG